MAIIDMVEWRPSSNNIYAWRYPEDNLSTATQLIVRESQEAVLFSKGRIVGKFGPGHHTLSTENLPILRSLYGIPFGKKNPFTAEVFFTNKASPLTIDWTTNSMRIIDPDYNVMVPLVAKGRYGVKVQDSERFLVKLVGTMTEFTTASLTNHFMAPLIAKTNSNIISFMTANKIGINQVSAYLDRLSTFIDEPMKAFWEDYGLLLTGFYITSIDINTQTEEGKKISAALSDRTAQSIAGYTWQQKEAFNTANSALTSGGNIGVLGAALMTGMMGNSAMGASILTPPMPQNQASMERRAGQTNIKEVFCSNCGKKFSVTSKFCPYCGDPYNACPICGADNASNARRCVSCGASLIQENTGSLPNTCSRCGAAVEEGVKFCPNCGNKL